MRMTQRFFNDLIINLRRDQYSITTSRACLRWRLVWLLIMAILSTVLSGLRILAAETYRASGLAALPAQFNEFRDASHRAALGAYIVYVAGAVILADAANGAIPTYWAAGLAHRLGLVCLALALWLLRQGVPRQEVAYVS